MLLQKQTTKSSTVSYTTTGLQVGAVMQGMKTHYTFYSLYSLNSFYLSQQNETIEQKLNISLYLLSGYLFL